MNSEDVIRHYQLRGPSHLPWAASAPWAPVPLDSGVQKTEHVSPSLPSSWLAHQLSRHASNGFVKPKNLTHFSSGERVKLDAKPGSRIWDTHLDEAGSRCHSRQVVLVLPVPRISMLKSVHRQQEGDTVTRFPAHLQSSSFLSFNFSSFSCLAQSLSSQSWPHIFRLWEPSPAKGC